MHASEPPFSQENYLGVAIDLVNSNHTGVNGIFSSFRKNKRAKPNNIVSLEQSIEEHQHDEEEACETNHGVETLSSEATQAVQAMEAVEAAQTIEAMEAEAMADVAKDLREVSETLKPYIATTTTIASNESNEAVETLCSQAEAMEANEAVTENTPTLTVLEKTITEN